MASIVGLASPAPDPELPLEEPLLEPLEPVAPELEPLLVELAGPPSAAHSVFEAHPPSDRHAATQDTADARHQVR